MNTMEQPVLYSGWLEKQGGVFTGKAPFPTPSFNAVLFPNPKTETPSLSLQPPPLPFAVRRGVMAGAVAVAGDSASAGALSGQSNFITPLCWIVHNVHLTKAYLLSRCHQAVMYPFTPSTIQPDRYGFVRVPRPRPFVHYTPSALGLVLHSEHFPPLFASSPPSPLPCDCFLLRFCVRRPCVGWKRRYFELRGAAIEYKARDKERSSALGVIDLTGASVQLTYAHSPDGILEIASPKQTRIFYLRGVDEGSLKRWARVLSEHIPRVSGTGSDGNGPDIWKAVARASMDTGAGPAVGHTTAAAATSTAAAAAAATAIASTVAEHQKIFKSGWLRKRGKVNKGWKRRWFVLKDRSLEYCSSPQATEAAGIILISEGMSRIVALESNGKYSEQLELSSVEGRTFYLTSTVEGELEAWRVALQPRHATSRVNQLETAARHAAPSAASIAQPPRPAHKMHRVQKSFLHRMIKESLIKMTPAHKICQIGCGGHECRHCDPFGQFGPELDTAVKGLHASWVTHTILASSRPSDRLIAEHGIITQLTASGVTAIFNLQQSGEHKHCGDGLVDNHFSYTPERFVLKGISVYLFGWQDFGTPTLASLFKMVKVMAEEILVGGKVLVHCHAGLGRTGLLIACYLCYGLGYTAREAITLVRLRRARSIQTTAQANLVQSFVDFAASKTQVFFDLPANTSTANASSSPKSCTLIGALERQETALCSLELRELQHTPKIVVAIVLRLRTLLEIPQKVSELLEKPGAQIPDLLLQAKVAINKGQYGLVDGSSDTHLLFELLVDWLWQLSEPVLTKPLVAALQAAMAANKLDVFAPPAASGKDPAPAMLVLICKIVKDALKREYVSVVQIQGIVGVLSDALLQRGQPSAERRGERKAAPLTDVVQLLLWISTFGESVGFGGQRVPTAYAHLADVAVPAQATVVAASPVAMAATATASPHPTLQLPARTMPDVVEEVHHDSTLTSQTAAATAAPASATVVEAAVAGGAVPQDIAALLFPSPPASPKVGRSAAATAAATGGGGGGGGGSPLVPSIPPSPLGRTVIERSPSVSQRRQFDIATESAAKFVEDDMNLAEFSELANKIGSNENADDYEEEDEEDDNGDSAFLPPGGGGGGGSRAGEAPSPGPAPGAMSPEEKRSTLKKRAEREEKVFLRLSVLELDSSDDETDDSDGVLTPPTYITVVAEGDDSGGDEDGSGGGGGGETTPRASTGTVPFEEGVTSHLAAAAPADP